MQVYQLDLREYLCPLPLMVVKEVIKNASKPYQLTLLLNTINKTDIELFLAKEHILFSKIEENSIVQLSFKME